MDKASQAPEYKKMLEAEAALPDSYISGQSAQAYVQKWVTDLQDLMTKNSGDSSGRTKQDPNAFGRLRKKHSKGQLLSKSNSSSAAALAASP